MGVGGGVISPHFTGEGPGGGGESHMLQQMEEARLEGNTVPHPGDSTLLLTSDALWELCCEL